MKCRRVLREDTRVRGTRHQGGTHGENSSGYSSGSIDRLGVDTIFSFPGDGINRLFEALRQRKDKLRYVQVRHEEAAAFAACGYAEYAGRLGVSMATSGPGDIHLLNGLYDAKEPSKNYFHIRLLAIIPRDRSARSSNSISDRPRV